MDYCPEVASGLSIHFEYNIMHVLRFYLILIELFVSDVLNI